LLLATPAQFVRATVKQLAAFKSASPIVICAKGIDETNAKLVSEVVAEVMPGRALAVLSGPSFAIEVARDWPAALTLASADKEIGERIVETLASRHFRLYLSDDIIGAQIGGAIKNVLAVACGIVAGRGLGDNARAALITRGLAEMTRLGLALGAKAETLAGLSGLGDLVLTCSSLQSRNMSLGAALGKGQKLEDILASRMSVTEGVATAAAALALAKKHGVEMPIVTAVDAILNKKAGIEETIEALLARPPRAEWGVG
jgi:glycerol-3-phosphate dehydrogenase (NAD(P)+)